LRNRFSAAILGVSAVITREVLSRATTLSTGRFGAAKGPLRAVNQGAQGSVEKLEIGKRKIENGEDKSRRGNAINRGPTRDEEKNGSADPPLQRKNMTTT